MSGRLRPASAVLLLLCVSVFAASQVSISLDVPFVKQEKNGCGAAVIAMVAQYWQEQSEQSGGVTNAADVQRELYSEKGRGIYASDMERYFGDRGFLTFTIRGEWADLQQHLEKGRPLIVALKPSGGGALHYVVVAGIDPEQQLVMVNDPAQRKLMKRERASFEREWKNADYWTLLALPAKPGH